MATSLQRRTSVESAADAIVQNGGTPQRRSSQTNLQTGRHNYIPFIPRRESMVIRDRVAGASEINKDCIPIYPYIKEDGTKLMVSQYDFNVKMQKKYKALLGDSYVYPVMDLDSVPKIAEEELLEITKDDKSLLDYFIPHEVEVMIPGGIRTLKKDANDNLYMFAHKDTGRFYAAKVKSVSCKEMKEFEANQKAMAEGSQFCVPTNTTAITSDEVINHLIAGMDVPNVRRVRNVFGISEGEDEILGKLRQMGLLEKYEDKIDDEEYFKTFVNNKSRTYDFGFDYRRWKAEEREYSFDQSEEIPEKTETEDKPSDTSFESEVDIEPFKLDSKLPFVTAPSCDSGLGLESPPMSPSSNSKSPTPCN